ncbi:hypothetical protein OJ996_24305 [Luteolibacter sp. GHJ8]|uniref:Verru_Chthon cassette protein A n=1 Tax=Luteolibacter rhizosphaerae TaxID=2989719 RepID=A0ABT3GA69_9BACT|nr:hypothetical protein [Luteolibacter rhizosphaerae]MCW1916732.1 hypothetical protein [Luteolibacter rhizosphaerae]
MPERHPRRSHAPGFTLPAVMIVSAAMLILAVGLIAIISIEKKTARSFADAKRAELAARAGLEDFRAILRKETANDDFLIIGRPSPNLVENSKLDAPSQLYVARGDGGGTNVTYRYTPLFSANEMPTQSGTLVAPEIPEVDDDDTDHATFKTLPWQDPIQVEWVPVKNEKGEMVARYAYWVEDLQSKVDAMTAGNKDGDGGANSRNAYPFPVSGINPNPPEEPTDKRLDQVAIHVLDPKATEDGDGKLTNQIVDGRPAMLSPDSVVGAVGYEAPLKRNEEGELDDDIAAALERSTSPIIQPYDEHPVVPYARGISGEAAGQPKRNLNELLNKSPGGAVDEFATWVDSALPEFKNRQGGFPEDYLRTIAANAFDYADTDDTPRVVEGRYRGIEGFPLVSEHMFSIKWDSVTRDQSRTYVTILVTVFAELWNMTNQPVSGQAQFSYETEYSMQVGAIPEIGLGDPELLFDPSVTATNIMREGPDSFWFPSINVSLRANEYKVFKLGEARMRIDVGAASLFVPSPLEVSNDDNQQSGYKMRWNNTMVDHSKGKLRHYDQLLYYPGNNATNSSQKVSATIPGHSYKLKTESFVNNMGDPRMSMYITAPQDANSWPQNYSPNRRTIRWGSIYSSDSAAKRKHYGRVLPSEWPDGGHNSPYGSNNFFTEDRRTVPDDPRFFLNLPTPVAEQAPMRMSNLGRFYSATELGRAYDPVMWRPTYGDLTGSPGSGARDTATHNSASPSLPPGRVSWPEVELNSPYTTESGGGNTLRIGRAEHPRFRDTPGQHAAHLLDLFHTGISTSRDVDKREGKLIRIEGNVNLNTAEPDAIRALVAGYLKQDPLLSQTTSTNHQTSTMMAQPIAALNLGTPTNTKVADRVAEAIVRSRPFACAADIAKAKDATDRPVFGNREVYAQNTRIEWTDSASEEMFSRLYEASTLRSRNFRVWVVGQAVYLPEGGNMEDVEVLSESKKAFTVFADPGDRDDNEDILETEYQPRVTHENDF